MYSESFFPQYDSAILYSLTWFGLGKPVLPYKTSSHDEGEDEEEDDA